MSFVQNSLRQMMMGTYAFHDIAPLSAKAFLPFPGVFALYCQNPYTNTLDLRFVGEVDHLETQLTYEHPMVQKLFQEVQGNKDRIYFTYRIVLSKLERYRIVEDLARQLSPKHNRLNLTFRSFALNQRTIPANTVNTLCS